MMRMAGGGAERNHGSRRAALAGAAIDPQQPKKKKLTAKPLGRSAALVWRHRRRLGVGLVIMVINRLVGLVLPATSKFLMDDVVGKQQWDLLPKLALAAGVATLIDAATSFANSQVLGVAAQRAITDMRKDVEAHVMRLPIRYFDSTKTGILISRIMSDAEGIRNLVGTGLVQLTGSIFTAIMALGVLFYLNWQLTAVTILVLGTFGGGMATAFKRLRPLFRERGQINAEVTGRLAESLGGVRIVKAYTAEKREELVFAKGAHRLFRNVAQSLTGVSAVGAFSALVIGAIGIAMMLVGGASIRAGEMTIGDFVMYLSFTGADHDAGGPARDPSARRSPRPSPGSIASARSAGWRPRTRRTPRARRCPTCAARWIRRCELRVQRGRAGAEARVVSTRRRDRRPRSSDRADRARARSSAW